jgi:hypothetical protein
LPAARLLQWRELLRSLLKTTPPDHPDYDDCADAVGVFEVCCCCCCCWCLIG